MKDNRFAKLEFTLKARILTDIGNLLFCLKPSAPEEDLYSAGEEPQDLSLSRSLEKPVVQHVPLNCGAAGFPVIPLSPSAQETAAVNLDQQETGLAPVENFNVTNFNLTRFSSQKKQPRDWKIPDTNKLEHEMCLSNFAHDEQTTTTNLRRNSPTVLMRNSENHRRQFSSEERNEIVERALREDYL